MVKHTIRHFSLPAIMAFALVVSLPGFAQPDRAAFKTEGLKCAINKLTGNAKVLSSKDITIRAPQIAENGAEVGISVIPKMKNVEQVAIFAERNATPLLASYSIPEGSTSIIRSRVKLRGDTQLVAVVKAGGKYYRTERFVKITVGGCGGGSSIPTDEPKGAKKSDDKPKTEKKIICK